MLWKAALIGVFAFIMAVLAFSMFRSSWVQPHDQPNNQATYSRSAQTTNENESWKDLWQRTKRDPIALFTAVLAISTTLLFIIAIGQLWFLISAERTSKRAANAAEDSAKIATQTLKITHRPWVNFDGVLEVVTPLTFEAAGAKLGIRFTLKNGGSAVAKNVTVVFGDLRIGSLPLPNEAAAILAPIYASQATPYDQFGRLILPGVTAEPTPHTTELPRANFIANQNGTITAWIYGVIRYQDEFGERHATSFIYNYIANGERRQFIEAPTVAGHLQITGTGNSAY
jgi:hypothetical protein